MRFLAYAIGDDSVPLPPASPELMAVMGEFMEEATKAGVLLATGGLAPSVAGGGESRLRRVFGPEDFEPPGA